MFTRDRDVQTALDTSSSRFQGDEIDRDVLIDYVAYANFRLLWKAAGACTGRIELTWSVEPIRFGLETHFSSDQWQRLGNQLREFSIRAMHIDHDHAGFVVQCVRLTSTSGCCLWTILSGTPLQLQSVTTSAHRNRSLRVPFTLQVKPSWRWSIHGGSALLTRHRHNRKESGWGFESVNYKRSTTMTPSDSCSTQRENDCTVSSHCSLLSRPSFEYLNRCERNDFESDASLPILPTFLEYLYSPCCADVMPTWVNTRTDRIIIGRVTTQIRHYTSGCSWLQNKDGCSVVSWTVERTSITR